MEILGDTVEILGDMVEISGNVVEMRRDGAEGIKCIEMGGDTGKIL
ncbi:MAG: hypothetical protein J5I98_03060 [Phaeodactylibacter sp.]|nr:hypothetical protein [Phaeodactylibacter sp.]